MPPETHPLIRGAAFTAGVVVLIGLLALLCQLPADRVMLPGVVRNNYEEGIPATALFYTESDIPLE